MSPIYNLNKKRVLDLSEDKREAIIRKGDCITIISVNKDGTLRYSNKKVSAK